jgi:hypothetical protein
VHWVNDMKRPAVVTAVIVIHLLAALALIGLSLYLLWLARSPETLGEQDAASAVQGLKIGAMVLAIPALLWMPGAYGMWKHRVWGWWLTLITGMGTASVLLYSAIDDGWHQLEADAAAVTTLFVILPLLLLFPQVRKYYRKPQGDPPAAIDTVQGMTHTTS